MTEQTPNAQVAPPRPDPVVARDNAFFWEAAKRGELVTRSCDSCGNMVHPPVPMCPRCHGLHWTEQPLSGRGKVASWLKVHHPKFPFFDHPVLVVTVELEEGPELISNMIDVEETDVVAGLPVEVAFVPTRGGWQVPVFRPRRDAVAG